MGKAKKLKILLFASKQSKFHLLCFLLSQQSKKNCFFAFAFLGKQSIFQQISKIQKTKEITPIYKNDQKYQSKISQKCHSYKNILLLLFMEKQKANFICFAFCFYVKAKNKLLLFFASKQIFELASLFAFSSKQKINAFAQH